MLVRRRAGVVVLALALVEGCAGMRGPVQGPAVDARLESRRFFDTVDVAVARAGVGDAGLARVPGFPYLRASRFLAAGVRPPPDAHDAFPAWVERLQRLDQLARASEIENLPEPAREQLRRVVVDGRALDELIVLHGDRMRAADLASNRRRRELSDAVRVPDAYVVGHRVLGLYPVTSMFFGAGVERLHARLARDFEPPLRALDVHGQLVTYRPPSPAASLSAADVAAILARSTDNPLGIPEPAGEDLQRLYDAFAPVFEVDVVTDDDRIGAPGWSHDPLPEVDVSRPTVYRRVSHARFESRTLLQLNYVIWFPARPRTGALDLLGGHVDGITWRVTLDADGRPLLHDAMHNCGCYHMFFPSRRLRYLPHRLGHEEPLFIPQVMDETASRLVVRIAHRTHYIQRVSAGGEVGGGTPYALASYAALQSLPAPGGRRSLFRSDGMVPGTERRERYLFWPMGIPEPGAMRQWGRHATAFVGRRHFDDPDLIGRYFERSAY